MHENPGRAETPSRAAAKPLLKPVVKINNFVRKHTQAVDLETLNQQGITRVNFLTFSKINDLISLAVARAFEKYQQSHDAADLERVGDAARRDVEASLKQAGAAPAETEVLERRIEKLKRQVSEMEGLLEVLSLQSPPEAPAEAVLRTLPGLRPADPRYEKKKGMLKIIFEDNLQLQKAGRP
jgi:hypothetical protein